MLREQNIWRIWRTEDAAYDTAAVLLYHSILQADNYYAIAPHVFAQHMRYLKAQYCPKRLLEVVEFVIGQGTLPDRAIAVTFDDGYADFLTSAFPLASVRQPLTRRQARNEDMQLDAGTRPFFRESPA
jgi:hypothetical protein